MNRHDPPAGVTRRSFIKTMGASAAVTAAGNVAAEAREEVRAAGQETRQLGPDPVNLELSINGKRVAVTTDPAATLAEVLRWELGLTGTKISCDRGACGACSILADGKLVNACMLLAVDAVGRSIRTIEGLAEGDDLDPVQAAFVRHDALQCGYCTPGLVMAARALLDEHPKPTLDQIKSGLAGNLCRCGAYSNVFNAVLDASGQPVPPDALPEGGVS